VAGNRFDEMENIFTFETGPGTETTFNSAEGSALANAQLVTSPQPPNVGAGEIYCLRCLAEATGKNSWTSPTVAVFGRMILGVWVQFNNTPTGGTNTFTFLEVKSGGVSDFRFEMNSTLSPDNAALNFIDAAGTSTLVGNNLFNNDSWKLMELVWIQGNSETMRVYLGGSLVKIISGADLRGSGGDITITVSGQPLGGTATTNSFFKTLYMMSTAFDNDSRLGNVVTQAYRVGKNSITPDVGVDLDAGNWQNISAGDSTRVAQYDDQSDIGYVVCDDTNSFGVPGPNGDISWHQNDTIVGGKWAAVLNSTGRGAGVAQLRYGMRDKVNGDTDLVSDLAVQGTGVHSASVFREFGIPPTRVPTGDDEMILGLRRNSVVSAQNAQFIEGWAILCYKAPKIEPGVTTVKIKGANIKGGNIK